MDGGSSRFVHRVAGQYLAFDGIEDTDSAGISVHLISNWERIRFVFQRYLNRLL